MEGEYLIAILGNFHFPVNTFVVFYLGARAARLHRVNKSGQTARASSVLKIKKCKLLCRQYERRRSLKPKKTGRPVGWRKKMQGV